MFATLYLWKSVQTREMYYIVVHVIHPLPFAGIKQCYLMRTHNLAYGLVDDTCVIVLYEARSGFSIPRQGPWCAPMLPKRQCVRSPVHATQFLNF